MFRPSASTSGRLATLVAACLVAAACQSTPATTTPASVAASTASPRATTTASAAVTSASPTPSIEPLPLLGAMPSGELDAATASRLQAVLDGAVRSGSPDAIAAVLTNDGSWSGAAGIDGPAHKAASTKDHFAIASVSKLILATLVVRLAEQGKLDLDAPIATYLGELGPKANDATVREALSMHSGLGDTDPRAISDSYAHCDRALRKADVVASIPDATGPAGAAFSYSNPTYKLVGYAAEYAAGVPLADAVRREVVEPAGAGGLLLQGPGTATPKPWARPIDGHTGDLDLDLFGVGGTLPCLGDSTLALGAAGMASDVASLARWGWAWFSGKIVSADALRDMTTVVSDHYGLGVERLRDFGPIPAFGHSGHKPGYASTLAVLPADGVVVVVFINDGDADVDMRAHQLVIALHG